MAQNILYPTGIENARIYNARSLAAPRENVENKLDASNG